MRKLFIGTMCLMLVLVGTGFAEPMQGAETCATATEVGALPYSDSGILGDTDDCVGRPYFDVFYVFTAPVAGLYTFDMCDSYGDTYMKIWTGGTCCSGTSVYNDDQCGGLDPRVAVTLALNQVVFIECGSLFYSGYAGMAYYFNVTSPYPYLPGDNCSSPLIVNLPAQLPYSDLAQRTCGRGNDYWTWQTCLGNYDGGEDMIYEVTVTSTVTVDISFYTNTYFAGICIDNSCPPDMSCIAMSTSVEPGNQTMSNVSLTPGTYYIMVDTYPASACIPSFDLNIVAAPPPPPPYYWANNCNQGTGTPHPRYNWVTETTNSVTCGYSSTPQDGFLGDDDWEGPFPIGFTFNYYGTNYTTFTICSNGFLMLGSYGNTAYSNVCIPNTAAPNNMLAWFWDDMDGGNGTPAVYYGNAWADGHWSMVVTFVNYRQYLGTTGITAQVILKDNGNVKYQYNTWESGFNTNSSTIGIENQSGAVGINYLCNGAGGNCFQPGMAVEFGPNQTQLPVELTSFDAVAMNEAVRLQWTTASETGNDHFALYRSTSEAGEFTLITTIAGVGESATENTYNYVDQNLTNGVTYYYRLADVDINGNINTHDMTVSATPVRGGMGMVVTEYKLHQNYPNPFNPNTTIVYDVKETGHVTLKIYNLLGREVATLVDELKDNNRYQVIFDASGLAAGVYFYRVNVNGFNDVAKMVILK